MKNVHYLLWMAVLFIACSNNGRGGGVNIPSQVYLPKSGFQEVSVNNSTSVYKLRIYYNKGYKDASINVNLKVDASLLEAYNVRYGTNYVLLPDSCYTIEKQNGTLSGKEKSDSTNIVFNLPVMMNVKVEDYVLPLSIECGDSSLLMKGKTTALLHLNYTMSNPVVSTSLPDPTVIRANGYYYVYATEDIHNVPILKSKDMVNWNQVGTVFTNATRPGFVSGGGIWAPDIESINGQYVLYYAMSTWGGTWSCGIGAATSASPEGPFTDHGKLFISSEIGVQNSIDPCYIEDNGKKYLIWGSFFGIYAVELTNDGLQVATGANPVKIVGTAYEGSYVFKRGAYYYYFGSTGSCCSGVNSTYKVVYGRSKSLFGPYTDKEGESLMDNKYDVLIGSNDYFVGNGHDSGIVQDDAGEDWMFYHGYVKSSGQGRYLMLSRVKWDDQGWPYVDGGSPEKSFVPPIINR